MLILSASENTNVKRHMDCNQVSTRVYSPNKTENAPSAAERAIMGVDIFMLTIVMTAGKYADSYATDATSV